MTLRERREALGLSRPALAAVAACSPETVKLLEIGYAPKRSRVVPRVEQALKLLEAGGADDANLIENLEWAVQRLRDRVGGRSHPPASAIVPVESLRAFRVALQGQACHADLVADLDHLIAVAEERAWGL